MNEITRSTLKDIEHLSIDEGSYILENSKDNRNVVRVKRMDKFIYIGSKYSVERDIEQLFNKINELNIETIVIVYGLGSGEHIKSLVQKTTFSNKIVVVEPDENIIKLSLANKELKSVFENDRVYLYSYNNYTIDSFLSSLVTMENMNNIELISYANYDRIYPEQMDTLTMRLSKLINDRILDLNTSISFADKYFDCFINNFNNLVKSKFINDFKDKFKDKPAIIVSAGPSLEKNIHLLKDVQDKLVIIAGGRTFKTLLDVGVTPDFVCTIDPGDPSYIIMQDVLDKEVPLVCNEVSNHRLVQDYKGKKIFFTDLYLDGISGTLIDKNIDTLYQGGSVAHICTSFGAYIGCNPIIFIGQDFAYTNNKYHAKIAEANISQNMWDPDSSKIINSIKGLSNSDASNDDIGSETKKLFGKKAEVRSTVNREIFMVEDVFGNEVPTNLSLNFYKELMEQFICENPQIHFLNCTEGGAHMRGTEVSELKTAIKKFSCKLDKNIEAIMNTPNGIDTFKVGKKIKDTINVLKQVKNRCEKGIELSEKIYKLYNSGVRKNMDPLFSDLNKVDNFINSNLNKVNIVKTILYPELAKVTMDLNYMEKIGEDKDSRVYRVAEKSKKIYEAFYNIIAEALPMLEQLAEEIK